MKQNNSDIEFYREALARIQQEKAAYAEENRALREEILFSDPPASSSLWVQN